MPRKSSVPSYRLHKASGQARTIVNGRHIYLGKYGSPESRQQYARILAEAALPAGTPSPDRSDSQRLLVSELLVASNPRCGVNKQNLLLANFFISV